MEYKTRPPRLNHVFDKYTNPLYFVTICTYRRQPILAEQNIHDAFVAHAQKASEIGVGIGCYVIMPDHIHLFIRISMDQKLGTSVKYIKQAITKDIHRNGSNEQIWQSGFFDHLMRNSESYSQKWDYVRINPVRAGLVQSPEDWPYMGEVVRIDRV